MNLVILAKKDKEIKNFDFDFFSKDRLATLAQIPEGDSLRRWFQTPTDRKKYEKNLPVDFKDGLALRSRQRGTDTITAKTVSFLAPPASLLSSCKNLKSDRDNVEFDVRKPLSMLYFEKNDKTTEETTLTDKESLEKFLGRMITYAYCLIKDANTFELRLVQVLDKEKDPRERLSKHLLVCCDAPQICCSGILSLRETYLYVDNLSGSFQPDSTNMETFVKLLITYFGDIKIKRHIFDDSSDLTKHVDLKWHPDFVKN